VKLAAAFARLALRLLLAASVPPVMAPDLRFAPGDLAFRDAPKPLAPPGVEENLPEASRT